MTREKGRHLFPLISYGSNAALGLGSSACMSPNSRDFTEFISPISELGFYSRDFTEFISHISELGFSNDASTCLFDKYGNDGAEEHPS
jgi:hypothetical protein